jgi:hypothetical protein
MTRPKRINLSGCVHRMTCRADRNDVIFKEDKDKDRFLEYMGEYAEQFAMRNLLKGNDSIGGSFKKRVGMDFPSNRTIFALCSKTCSESIL